MGNMFYRTGSSSGFQYGKRNNTKREDTDMRAQVNRIVNRDEDLIIDDNTVYEIDRECYERLNRQKKKK